MERIGKFSCSESLINEVRMYDFFNRIKFTPIGVEYFKSEGIYEYIGYSPYFEEVIDGDTALEYNITFSKHFDSKYSTDYDISVRVEPCGEI